MYIDKTIQRHNLIRLFLRVENLKEKRKRLVVIGIVKKANEFIALHIQHNRKILKISSNALVLKDQRSVLFKTISQVW
jgi:hypothetical protein